MQLVPTKRRHTAKITRCKNPEYHQYSHQRKNLKSYKDILIYYQLINKQIENFVVCLRRGRFMKVFYRGVVVNSFLRIREV